MLLLVAMVAAVPSVEVEVEGVLALLAAEVATVGRGWSASLAGEINARHQPTCRESDCGATGSRAV